MKNNSKKIAVFGAGGFGREVRELISQINEHSPEWDFIGFFDDAKQQIGDCCGGNLLGGLAELNEWSEEISVVLALGMPEIKKKVFEKIVNKKIQFPTLIHPSVIMGDRRHIIVGEGSIICAANIITTNINVGKLVILNLACTVGHDAVIGDFSSLMPGCNISGEVVIGESVFMGTGSKIINRVKVGCGCVIGAGAVVISNIPDQVLAVGVPAKVVKSMIRGE